MNNDLAVAIITRDSEDAAHRVGRMLEIQDHALIKEKAWDMLDGLKVLTLSSSTFLDSSSDGAGLHASNDRTFTVDHISHENYLALSYTWNPSLYEEKSPSSWQVYVPNQGIYPSIVRNAVFDRVTAYMLQVKIRYLWLDRECIDQANKVEKQRAMQSMDLIYRTSRYALGLLFVPLRTPGERETLDDLLSGKLVVAGRKRRRDQDYPELALSAGITSHSVLPVLDLLHRLTSDEWWSRGWCFQESYLSMENMKLLLPCQYTQAQRKAAHGHIQGTGDYSIDLSTLCIQTTRFVFAYIATGRRKRWRLDHGICRQILDKAGWYNLMAVHGHLLLDFGAQGRPMSTQIFADLQRKTYTVPSDLLHVASNCNRYQFAFDTAQLDETKASLSNAILTLYFLNGEIFWNGTSSWSIKDMELPPDANVFDYLKKISFHSFPVDAQELQLSRLRKYRFVRPQLTKHGVRVSGHLWKLDKVLKLESSRFQQKNVKGVLRAVADRINDDGVDKESFVGRLKGFIKHEYAIAGPYETPESTRMMSSAAARLARHIQDGGRVALASVSDVEKVDPDEVIGIGIFALPDADDEWKKARFFTAWQRGAQEKTWFKRPEEDKYVSLRVTISEAAEGSDVPQLRVHSWTDALCFFEGIKSQSYIFPWPKSLVVAAKG